MEIKTEEQFGNGDCYKVTIKTTGIKKRCRKQSRIWYALGYCEFREPNELDKTMLKNAAIEKFNTTMKTYEGIEIHLDKACLNHKNVGMNSTIIEPCSEYNRVFTM